MIRTARPSTIGLAIGLAIGAGVTLAPAQAPERPPAPDEQRAGAPDIELSAPVRRRLEASYLSGQERRALRVEHGVWTEEDLEDQALAAAAALSAGAYAHAALADEDAHPEDRAEALIARGDPEAALAILGQRDTVRAVALRARALDALARYDDADEAIRALLDHLQRTAFDSADEAALAVQALNLRTRIRGPELGGGADYRTMIRMLATARDDLDRLSWRVRLAEAEILYERHNRSEARDAAIETLRLNPRAARAWRVLGLLMVDQFNFAAAEQIAAKLDAIVSEAGDEGPSVYAAEIRARARLRERDPGGALQRLEPVLARHPGQRTLRALEAAAVAIAFRFDRSDALLDEFDALSPGSPVALFETGRALSEARQYAEAADHLERAAARLPTWAGPIMELGLLEMQAGRDSHARRALARAVELDPFNMRASNSLRLIEELLTYDTVESEHFVVRYRPGVDEVLAREMLPVLERIHARVAGEGDGGIDHTPDRRTVVELMPDHEWFSVRITGITQVHTMAAATGPVIAIESPRDGPRSSLGPYDWERVMRHEYVHTVTLSRTRNRIPHWFTEAAAVYLEDAPRDYRTWRLLLMAYETGRLFDLEEINIAFVRPERPSDRAQAYAQGHWMYEFIVDRWSDRAPLDLMDLYAEGTRESEAFQTVLGLDPAGFLDAFRAWAEDDLIAGGLLPSRDQPDLRNALAEAATSDDEDAEDDSPGRPDPETVYLAIELYPDHPDLLDLAVALELEARGGRPDASMIELLERYAEARPVDDAPRRHLARVLLDEAEGADPERAAPHLEFLDAREQNSPSYAAELARIYADAGDWSRAHVMAERTTRIAPFVPRYRDYAARVAIRAGDLAAAEQHIHALTVLEPDRSQHQRRLEAIRELRTRAN